MELSKPAVFWAESPGCDSPGWSVQRAAPGPLTRFRVPSSEFRVPIQPGTRTLELGTPIPNAEPSDGLSGLGEVVGNLYLGLRSQTRSSPGYHRTGLQPSKPDKHNAHAVGVLRLLFPLKTSRNLIPSREVSARQEPRPTGQIRQLVEKAPSVVSRRRALGRFFGSRRIKIV